MNKVAIEQTRVIKSQSGAVLIGALILLLVITIVGFGVMETSNLETKMATTRELKEISFQAAEAMLSRDLSVANTQFMSQAYTASLENAAAPNWPTQAHSDQTYNQDGRNIDISGTTTMRFIVNAPTIGYSLRKGSSGLDTYYYELQANARMGDTNISNQHVQGVYLEAPRVN